jgi:hypothetical protein
MDNYCWSHHNAQSTTYLSASGLEQCYIQTQQNYEEHQVIWPQYDAGSSSKIAYFQSLVLSYLSGTGAVRI